MATGSPKDIIILLAPEYASDTRLDDLVVLAQSQTGAYCSTIAQNQAVAYLVLHWLALENRGSGATSGIVGSEKEGQLQRSYTFNNSIAGGSSVGDLGQTFWGLRLLNLRKGCIIGVRNRTIPEV